MSSCLLEYLNTFAQIEVFLTCSKPTEGRLLLDTNYLQELFLLSMEICKLRLWLCTRLSKSFSLCSRLSNQFRSNSALWSPECSRFLHCRFCLGSGISWRTCLKSFF